MTWDVTTDTVEVEIDMATETPIAADWGEIGGDIDEQADLKNRLDAKQDTIPANTYDPYGAASSAVSAHNSANDAHSAKFAAKQDTIADLSTIRSGASAGATAYQKPASGIPSTDMATAVQTSLGKADTALQDAPSDGKQYARKDGSWAEVQGGGGGTSDHTQLTNRDAANQHPISAINGLQAALDGKGTYSKPSGGIPKADLASSVQTSLVKADTAIQEHQSLAAYRTAAQQDAIHDATKQDVVSDLSTIRSGAAAGSTAYQKPASGIAENDLSSSVNTSLDKADSAYQKPAGGVPKSDMASDVQTSLGKADTAIQQHQSLAAYRTSAAQDVIDAGLQSGIDAKYSKPDGGIPKSDLASGVQGSLDKADTAIQEHQSLAAYRTSAAQDTIDAGKLATAHASASDAHSALFGAKQDTINDLSTIRSGAALGATALQSVPNTYRTAAEQDAIHDATKQDTLTNAQLAAANSGITSADKTKLDGIAAGAEVNVNADWNATSGDAQILNKPEIPSLAPYRTAADQDVIDDGKVDKETGKGLSTNDYTTAEKNKLAGIEVGEGFYGLRRTGSSTYTRTGAAYGKTFAYSSDTYAGWSDFDEAYPFKLVRVKIHFDSSLPKGYEESSVEGAANWDTCTDDVFVRCPNAWIYEADNGLTGADARVEKKVSMAPFTGAWRAFSTLKSDGTLWEPDYFYIGAYEMTKDGSKGASKSGQMPYAEASTATLLSAARNTSQIACLCPEMAYEYMRIMISIELGTDDLQNATDANGAKMPGFSGGIYGAGKVLSAAASNTNIISMSAANLAAFVVGQSVRICNGWITSDVTNTRTIEAIDAEAETMTISGDAVTAAAGCNVYNMDWIAGSTDSILGHTGQKVLSSGKYAMKWRGIEQFYGGCGEAIADLRIKLNQGGTHRTWYCQKLLSMSGADVKTSDYVDTGIDSPGSDGYITCLGRGTSYPQVSMPRSAGGSSTTYYGDYYYQNAYDDRMPRAGNNWFYGPLLGGASRNCSNAASFASRYYGARLCFLP